MFARSGEEDLSRCMVEIGCGEEAVRCPNAPVFVASGVDPDGDGCVPSVSICESCVQRYDALGVPLGTPHPRVLTPIPPSYLVVITDRYEGDEYHVGTFAEVAEALDYRGRLPLGAEVWSRTPATAADRERLDAMIREAYARKMARDAVTKRYQEVLGRIRKVQDLLVGATPGLRVELEAEWARLQAQAEQFGKEITP